MCEGGRRDRTEQDGIFTQERLRRDVLRLQLFNRDREADISVENWGPVNSEKKKKKTGKWWRRLEGKLLGSASPCDMHYGRCDEKRALTTSVSSLSHKTVPNL